MKDGSTERAAARADFSSCQEIQVAFGDDWKGPSPQAVSAALTTETPEVIGLVCWRGAAGPSDLCYVQLALAYLTFLQQESCGRCTPCRVGIHHMLTILERLQKGVPHPDDLSLLQTLVDQIADSAWCGIANTIRDPLSALLRLGAEDLARHARGEKCPPLETTAWMAAPCRSTCPAGVDCPTYLFQAAESMPYLASATIRRDNPLPAVVGRTCPHPCEAACTLGQIGEPVAINAVKRWSADRAEGVGDRPAPVGGWELAEAETADPDGHREMGGAGGAQAQPARRPASAPRAASVAIVGAGPAGLSAAYYLARAGYRPLVFETLPVPGGMLYVGIPEYRLPKAVLLEEVAAIQRQGVEIRYGCVVGRDVSPIQLLADHAALFIAIGAHAGRSLNIPGEDLQGSLDAIDFLRRVALGEKVDVGERILVVGGGNSAMDAARTCIRLGAKEVTVVYRRDRGQMPANPWEVREAEEEGVRFQFLAAPLRCEGTARVSGLVCQPMELGAPDESGRLRPVPAARDPIRLQADTIIAAVGQRPDFSPFLTVEGLTFDRWDYLECDHRTLMTSLPGVFVGGDALSGGGLVIEAIAAGKRAAVHIGQFLEGKPVREHREYLARRVAALVGARESQHVIPPADFGHRQRPEQLGAPVRVGTFAEVEARLTDQQAHSEAKRCLRCHRPLVLALRSSL